MPLEEPLQHNVLRGTLGGRDVCFWHWRYAWPIDDDGDLGPGTYHAVVVKPPLSRLWSAPRRFFSRSERDHLFVGVPCSAAATLVPEAALLPDITISTWPGRGREQLDELPGYQLTGELPPPVRAALAAGPLGDVLRAGARHALFELRFRFGTLWLRRNGYAAAPGEVDELLEAVRAAGDALRDACAGMHDPQPFGETLTAARWPEREPGTGRPWPPSPLLERLHQLTRARGYVLEEPQAYHRAFPSCPVPGRAFAVMRAEVEGARARLAFHTEVPLQERSNGRTALLLPANGAAPTEPGGAKVEHAGDPMRYAVRDGIFAVWILRWRPLDLGDVDALLGRGLEVARETGALA
jgi:hypothetical protein